MVVYARAADEGWPELAWLATMDAPHCEAFHAQHRGKLRTIADRQAAVAESATGSSERPLRPRASDSQLAGLTEFRDDDEGNLAWIAAHPDGYVVNILRGLNPAPRASTAPGVGRSAAHRRAEVPGPGPYIKVCASQLDELERWAAQYVGQLIARCAICQPPGSG